MNNFPEVRHQEISQYRTPDNYGAKRDGCLLVAEKAAISRISGPKQGRPLYTRVALVALGLALALFMLASSAHAGLIVKSPSSLGLAKGLVGYWTMDGSTINGANLTDKSGLGNTGTITGAVPIEGKLGQALKFNGSSYVSVGTGFGGITGSMSMCAWAKMNTLPTGVRIIFSKGNNSWGAVIFDYLDGGNPHFGTAVVTTDPSTVEYDALDTSLNLSVNQWNHVCGVFDNTEKTISLYINGAYIKQIATGSTLRSAEDVSYVGEKEGGSYYNGSIDDVRIYNRALTASEVKQLYNMGR